jgi:uncharacterized protein (DUF1697 family)
VTRLACLLRGVNVGGKNRVAMRELRALFESLGFTEVETLIQSGNVVFSSTSAVTAPKIEAEIRRAFGLDVSVVMRTITALNKVLAANPFADRDTHRLHVAFLGAKPGSNVVGALDGGRFAPEEFSVGGTEVYLYLPNGMARTKLPSYLERNLKVPMTIRNWNTATKLAEMAGR